MPLTRARDLRNNIKNYGFEKGVVYTLELMLDEMAEIRQHIRGLTQLSAQCIDQVERMVHVGGEMRKVIDQIKRDQQHGDEHGDLQG